MPLTQIKMVSGGLNTSEERMLANVRSAIRRQLPQVRPYQPQPTPVALVASGPSLVKTISELRDCLFRGCKVAAVNGAYQWCIDHNIKPSIAIALDARPENATFFQTPVDGCKYLLASQCAPAMFDAVDGRDVWIWHGLSYGTEEPILDAYYQKHVVPVDGGSTVTVRALSLLRMLGFLRMDVFGFDSCWMDGQHHAFPQALNHADQRQRVTMRARGDDQPDRVFECAPWHLKQYEDFENWVKARGNMVDLHVHGDGMIAHAIRTGARIYRNDVERTADTTDPVAAAHR